MSVENFNNSTLFATTFVPKTTFNPQTVFNTPKTANFPTITHYGFQKRPNSASRTPSTSSVSMKGTTSGDN